MEVSIRLPTLGIPGLCHPPSSSALLSPPTTWHALCHRAGADCSCTLRSDEPRHLLSNAQRRHFQGPRLSLRGSSPLLDPTPRRPPAPHTPPPCVGTTAQNSLPPTTPHLGNRTCCPRSWARLPGAPVGGTGSWALSWAQVPPTARSTALGPLILKHFIEQKSALRMSRVRGKGGGQCLEGSLGDSRGPLLGQRRAWLRPPRKGR